MTFVVSRFRSRQEKVLLYYRGRLTSRLIIRMFYLQNQNGALRQGNKINY